VSSLKTVVDSVGGAAYKPPPQEIEDVVAGALPGLMLRRVPGVALLFLTFVLVMLALATMALVAVQIFVQLTQPQGG
jgi:succinate dehydrogenase hydrophobic anchor subunit